MIALFIIGILVFTGKLIHFACKAAWGITRGVLFVIGIPALLMVLFVAGLVSLAIPLLVLALAAAFVFLWVASNLLMVWRSVEPLAIL